MILLKSDNSYGCDCNYVRSNTEKSKNNSFDGNSVRDITTQADHFVERNLFFKGRKMKAIRKQNWKYIVDGYSQLLFNLETDISERTNVFHKHIKKPMNLS